MTAKIDRPRKVREVTNGFVLVIDGTTWVYCEGMLSLAFRGEGDYTMSGRNWTDTDNHSGKGES